MTTISVVISAYNEEKKIGRTLASLRFADEIVLVDNNSSDKTCAEAGKYQVKIYHRKNNPMLNINKNYGFGVASSDWVLCLDADEEIPVDLAREIRHVITHEKKISGYWIARKNIIFGKWIEHGLWWPDKQLRLFRKGRGQYPCKHVHEYLEVQGITSQLTHPFIHYNYETISQFIRKMDTIYTENEVQQLVATHYQPTWYDAIRFPISDFVKVYLAEEAYKDGLHGLVISMLQAFYSFIVFAKLWEHHRFEERTITLDSVENELQRSAKEVSYWTLTSQIKNSSSPIKRVWCKLLRRLKTSS
jgi:(heptosyl)LPS beta-1,4-glucosyltransferase